MSASAAPNPADVRPPPTLDRRFVQWLALQTLHDRHARLVEGGAEADAQKIDLASIFIDLPVHAPRSAHRSSSEPNLAMPHLLGMTPWIDLRISKHRSRSDVSPRMLLLGDGEIEFVQKDIQQKKTPAVFIDNSMPLRIPFLPRPSSRAALNV